MAVQTKNQIEYKTIRLSNGRKVNYVHQGAGEPVVMVHGLAASLHDWDDLLPEVSAAGYAGYALDLLGHGESEKPSHTHDYSVENAYADFSAWIDSLNISFPINLIGHSLGGGLSLLYTYRNPEKVKSLVLVNPFYSMKQLPQILQKMFHHQLINTTLIDRTPYRVFRFFVDMTSFSTYIGSRETHVLPEHIRYQTALDYKRAASGIYNMPRTLHHLDLDLARITQPTLLLWGGRDQTLAPSSFPQLAEKLPNLVKKHSFPICGHVPHQCHPADFNPYVMEFLDKN
ncbi:MAG TPA: alpha/beta hydrolase [Anaerolineales bacterium]|nr:alpha/beta hydrolase [Anaerolineales bacterium]HNO94420.1 alpha/beta hydrolase [Anaerolineales bacterium]